MTKPLTVTLNDGHVMPQLGLGVWQTPPDVAAEVVKTALKAGYRAVDTAAAYRNEKGVGEGLKAAPREELFVTTKLWNDNQGYDSTLEAFDKSLGRLGLDVIDLYLIHWPAPSKGLYLDSWKALVRLKEEGRARSIGVSNFASEHLQRVVDETGVTPAVNQIELHPSFQQRSLRAFHAKHGKTPAQVVIRWHLDSGLIVIPKSVTASRIVENIAVFDFALDAGDMTRMAALDRVDGRIGPDPVTANF